MKGGGGKKKSKGNKKGRGKANPELEAALQNWEPVIGIEIHAQLSSSTKVDHHELGPCCHVFSASSVKWCQYACHHSRKPSF